MARQKNLGTLTVHVAADTQKLQKNLSGASAMLGRFKSFLGTLGLGFSGLFAVNEAKRFGAELANVMSVAAHFSKTKLKSAIKGVSAALGEASDIAAGVYYAASAGIRGTEQQLVDFVKGGAEVAKAINAAQQQVIDAGTTMISAYGRQLQRGAQEVWDWMTLVVRLGKTTGAELSAGLGQIASTAAGAGARLADLGVGLAGLTRQMKTPQAISRLARLFISLTEPVDTAATYAQRYGIELSAAAMRARGLLGVLHQLDAAQKSGASLKKILGSDEAVAAARTLLEQLPQLSGDLEAFRNSAGATGAALAAVLDDDAKRWEAVGVAGRKVAETLGASVLEMSTLGGALNPALKALADMDHHAQQLLAHVVMLGTTAFFTSKVNHFIDLPGRLAAPQYGPDFVGPQLPRTVGIQLRQLGLAVKRTAVNFANFAKSPAAWGKALTSGCGAIKNALTGGATGLAGAAAALGNALIGAQVALSGFAAGKWLGQMTGISEKLTYMIAGALTGKSADEIRQMEQQNAEAQRKLQLRYEEKHAAEIAEKKRHAAAVANRDAALRGIDHAEKLDILALQTEANHRGSSAEVAILRRQLAAEKARYNVLRPALIRDHTDENELALATSEKRISELKRQLRELRQNSAASAAEAAAARRARYLEELNAVPPQLELGSATSRVEASYRAASRFAALNRASKTPPRVVATLEDNATTKQLARSVQSIDRKISPTTAPSEEWFEATI